jgi:hypothetical protein
MTRCPAFSWLTDGSVSDIRAETGTGVERQTGSNGLHHPSKAMLDERITAETALDDAR